MLRPGRDMSWKDLLVRFGRAWATDRLDLAAGAVAFYAMLSIFPFLVFLVALASLVIDSSLASQLLGQLGEVAPPQVTDILGGALLSLGESSDVGLLGLGGFITLWSASTGMLMLMDALNAVYEARETRPYWKTRGLSMLVVLVSAVLILLASVAIVLVTPLLDRLHGPVRTAVTWLRFPVGMTAVGFAWAMFYSALPNASVKFRLITPGSVVGVLLWTLASAGFSLYVGHFGEFEATYGALGGVVVFLLWLWITANAVLLGAEVNTLLDERYEKGRAWKKRLPCEPPPVARESPDPQPTSRVRWVAGLALLFFLRRPGS